MSEALGNWYDLRFQPWRLHDGHRVLAEEHVWQWPREWEEGDAAAGRFAEEHLAIARKHRRILVDCDWAEEWTRSMRDANNSMMVHSGSLLVPVTMDDARFRLLDLAAECSNLNWLFLAKRPERVQGILRGWQSKRETFPATDKYKVPPHFWFGTSVSDQRTADAMIPELLKVRDVAPQSKLFVVAEPLLGPIDWSHKLGTLLPSEHGQHNWCERGVDWIILGGESGPAARPCDIEWIRDSVRQCQAVGVACFVQQLGATRVIGHKPANVWLRVLSDPKGGDPSEWAEDLRVREIPS